MAVGSVRLPELKQEIKVDTKDLDRAIAAAKKFKSEMERSLKVDAAGNDKSFADLEARIGRMAEANRKLRQSTDEVGQSFRRQVGDVDNFASSVGRAEQSIRSFSQSSRGAFDIDTSKWQQQADKVASTMRNLTSESRELLSSQNDLGEGFRSARDDSSAMATALDAAAAAAARLRAALAGSFDIDTSQWETSAGRVRSVIQELTEESRRLLSAQQDLGGGFRQTRQDAEGTANTLDEIAAAAARARAALAGSFDIDTSRWQSEARGVLDLLRELGDATDDLRTRQEALGGSFRQTRDDANEAAAALTALAAAARAVSSVASAGFDIDTSSWMRQTSDVRSRLAELLADTRDLVAGQEDLGTAFRNTRDDAHQAAAAISAMAAAARALDGAGDGFDIDTSRWMSQTAQVRSRLQELLADTEDLIGSQRRLGEQFRATREDANTTAAALSALAAAARALGDVGAFDIDTSRWEAQIGQARETLRGLAHDTREAASAAEDLGEHMRRMRGDADETRTALEALAAAAAAFAQNTQGAFNVDTSRWRSEVSEVRAIIQGLNDDSERLLATQQKLGAGFAQTRETLTDTTGSMVRLGDAAQTVAGRTENLTRAQGAAQSSVRAVQVVLSEQEIAAQRLAAALAKLEAAEHKLAEARVREEAEALRVFAANEKVTVATEKGTLATQELEDAEAALARARASSFATAERIADLEDAVATKRIALGEANVRAAEAEAKLSDAAVKHENAMRAVTTAVEARTEAETALAELHTRLIPAEQQLSAARRDVADASDLIGEAEQRLRAAREQQDYATRAVAIAERELRAARADSDPYRLAFAEAQVSVARENSVRRATELEDAERRLASAHRDHESALGRLRSALGGVNDEHERTQGVLGRVGGAFRTLGAAIASSASGLLEVAGGALRAGLGFAGLAAQAALVSAAIGGISFLVGAVGAALGGLVPVVAATIPIIGTLALGFQNFGDAVGKADTPAEIKKQQEALAKLSPEARDVADVFNKDLIPAFEGVQKKVQDALFKDLSDDFRKLTDLAGPLGDGMVGIAGALNDVAEGFIKAITEGEGIERINGIMRNAKDLVTGMKDPLLNLGDTLSDVASRSELMRPMIGIFQDLTNNTANWLQRMADSGAAEAALQRLRSFLDNVERAFFNVLESATRFFTEAEPGVSRLVTAVGNVTSALLDRLGPAFGTAADAAGDLLDSIPDSTWQGITDAVGRLATKINELANDRAFQRFVDGVVSQIQPTIDGINGLIGVFQGTINVLDTLSNNIPGFGDALNRLLFPVTAITSAFENVVYWVSKADQALGTTEPYQDRIIATREAREALLEVANQAGATAEEISEYDAYLRNLPPEVITDIQSDPAKARQTYEDWKRREVEGSPPAPVDISGNTDPLQRDVDTARGNVENAPPAPVQVGGDTRPLDDDVRGAGQRIRDAAPVPAGVGADVDPFTEGVQTARDETEGADPARTPVGANLEQFRTELGDERTRIENVGASWKIPLQANFSAMQEELGIERMRIEEAGAAWSVPFKANFAVLQTDLGNERVRVEGEGAAWAIPLRANLAQFQTDLGNERTRVEGEGAAWAIPLRANFDQFNADLAAKRGEIEGAVIAVPLAANIDRLNQQYHEANTFISNTIIFAPIAANIDRINQQYNEMFNFISNTIIIAPIAGDFSQLAAEYDRIVQIISSTPVYIPIYGMFMGMAGGGIGGGGGGGGGAGGGGGGGGVRYVAEGAVFDYFASGGMSPRDRQAMKAMLGGGIEFNAGGNMRDQLFSAIGLTPMSGASAQIVPPNTWRVVGDRAVDDEAFIPINGSPRSQMLLEETARRMGYALQKMAQGGFGNASTTTSNPSNDGGYTSVRNETNNTSAPLIGGDLVVTVPQDTPVQDSMDEVLFQLRRVQRGGVHVRNKTRGR